MRLVGQAAAVLTIAALVLPALSAARTVTDFKDWQNEATVVLSGPSFEKTVGFPMPVKSFVFDARVNISSVMPDAFYTGFPTNVSVELANSTVWAFNGTDFGALGRQDRFLKGADSSTVAFNTSGGQKTASFRLPKGADIRSARMAIESSGVDILGRGVYLNGADSEARGVSVSDAGDLNGDGYGDIILGAPYNASSGSNTGAAYIYFGGDKAHLRPDLALPGFGASGFFGYSVSGAGDVNDDGYDDVVVGAYGTSIAGKRGAGAAYIYFGGPSMDARPDVLLNGTAENDYFGKSVAGGGDFNGDGYDDVVVGAYYNDSNASNAGAAYVFFGGAPMDSGPDVSIFGSGAYDWLGFPVSCAGDINGDGFGDFVVGSATRALFFLGGANVDAVADAVFPLQSSYCSLAGAQDVNGDGFDDIIIGITTYPKGAAFIFFGGASIDAVPDMNISSNVSNDNFGCSVSGAGDVNGDGFDDVLVGAYYDNSQTYAQGAGYLFLGGAPMDAIPDKKWTGENRGEELGISVADAGDMNADGLDDIILGTWFNLARVYSSVGALRSPSVMIGAQTVWKEPNYVNGTNIIDDFALSVWEYMAISPASGTDGYNNPYIDVPLTIAAKSAGNISLHGLDITYLYESFSVDFAGPLTGYVEGHKAGADAHGNISVPLTVRSGSQGRLRLSRLIIDYDGGPDLVRPIPELVLDEDSANARLLNLSQHFADEFDRPGKLTFRVVSSDRPGIINVSISGDHFLAADASTGGQNDNWTGTVSVVVACSDARGLETQSPLFRITVRNINDPPVITSNPVLEAWALAPYSYNLTAFDCDSPVLQYALTMKPEGMGINESGGQIYWIPPARGAFRVVAMVGDGQSAAFQEFNITVPNRPPVITSVPPARAFTASPFEYTVAASDEDRDTLTFELVRGEQNMSIDRFSGTLTWMPAEVGIYYIWISVSDGAATIRHDFTLYVLVANHPPIFNSTPVTHAVKGLPYSYNSSARDADGDPIAYRLFAHPYGMTVNSTTGRVEWLPDEAGCFTVLLKAVDPYLGESCQTFTVHVYRTEPPRLAIEYPSSKKEVGGTVAATGAAQKGLMEIRVVEVRIDGGRWRNATGTLNWTFSLDTTSLRNGRHTIFARAFDGEEYSEEANSTFVVDNPERISMERSILPVASAIAIGILIAGAGVAVWRWRRWEYI